MPRALGLRPKPEHLIALMRRVAARDVAAFTEFYDLTVGFLPRADTHTESRRAAYCMVLAIAALEAKKPCKTNEAKPTPLATIAPIG